MLSLAAQFQLEWSHHYGTVLPMGWHLRRDRTRPWVRFHALPLSKRYAENSSDEAIILSRANWIGDRVLGLGASCWLVEARYEDSDAAGDLWLTAREDEDPDAPAWRFYLRNQDWRSGDFDEKLLAIADDQPDRAIWMRRDTGAVFAPYDGGFDIFLTDRQEETALKKERPGWFSDHPEGL